jgi:hypothetical protein
VLLPWNDRVELRLNRAAVRATLHGGWPQRALLCHAERACAPAAQAEPGIPAWKPGAEAWRPALMSALDELQQHKPLQGLEVQVEIGDEFAHLDVAEGGFESATDAELDRMAEACLRETLGEDETAFDVRCHLQDSGRHLVLCALSRPLVRELRQALTSRGLVLTRLAPAFMRRWNRHRAGFGSGIFASVEQGHCVAALVQEGRLEAITAATCAESSEPASPDAPVTAAPPQSPLDTMVDRLLAGCGLDAAEPRHYVLIDRGPPHAALSQRWTVQPDLPGAAA